jgi:hypothetical protein
VIREYFLVCHRMSDHILLMYQEIKSLPRPWRDQVLENEVRVTGLFREAIRSHLTGAGLGVPGPDALELMAHNITVLGHMWTFRRWYFRGRFQIEDYIRHQTALILKELESANR